MGRLLQNRCATVLRSLILHNTVLVGDSEQVQEREKRKLEGIEGIEGIEGRQRDWKELVSHLQVSMPSIQLNVCCEGDRLQDRLGDGVGVGVEEREVEEEEDEAEDDEEDGGEDDDDEDDDEDEDDEEEEGTVSMEGIDVYYTVVERF